MTIINTISPKLLHKSSNDDVLLSNPRKVIPARFLSRTQLNNLNVKIESINKIYNVDSCSEYVLNMPFSSEGITGISFDRVINNHNVSMPLGVPYQVINNISNNDTDNDLFSILADDTVIEEFLEHHGVDKRSTSFNFINNADHYFFYRKPHEHVPGIMLLEAARQTIYYQLYTYSSHVLGEVTISLSELNAQFYAYAELMYPIEIIIDDLTDYNNSFSREVNYSTSFYQRGALIAKIDTVAPVIPLEKFKLARNACLINEENFTPLRNSSIVALITSKNMVQSVVNIQKIGKNQCTTSLPENIDLNDAYITIIYDGSISFQAPVTQVNRTLSNITWGFNKTEYSSLENLKEIIKRCFVVCETNINEL